MLFKNKKSLDIYKKKCKLMNERSFSDKNKIFYQPEHVD